MAILQPPAHSRSDRGTVTFAQAPQQPPTPAKAATPEKAIIPLKVQVTLSRYNGEKKTENLPFTLWVNANDKENTVLNLAQRVPLRTSGGAQYTVGNSTITNVGTSLTSGASTLDDGRFRLYLVIDDSSLVPGKDSESAAVPTLQSLTVSNYLLLRDGQTAQFVAATNKVTGEVTKVDVTITVLR